MRFVEVGGARVSVIGLGTWQFGSREWGYGEDYATRVAARITERALDLGVNLVDTAEMYGFGRSERIVGEAIATRRDDVFLATKLLPLLPLAPVVEWRARASAERLGVEQIDLYQVHWPNPLVPIATTMAGMAALRRSGVIRHVGVSNFSTARWRAAEAALGGPVLSNQVHYSLVNRGPQLSQVPYAQREARIVVAHSPLAQGLLSGRYDPEHRPRDRMRRLRMSAGRLRRAAPLIAALRDIARRHGATPSQVALAWLVRQPNVVAIPGASSVEQVEENAAAADLDLTGEEAARLEEASDRLHAGS